MKKTKPVSTSKLQIALEHVKPGISAQNTINMMGYFLFSGTHIVSYNNKISIAYPFKTEFELFVKAQTLFNIVSKISTKSVMLSEKANKLCVRTNTVNAQLATIKDEEVAGRMNNVAEDLADADWSELPDNFNTSISLCAFSASTQESAGTLSCVRVSGDVCVASNNIQIAHIKLSSKMDDMFILASEIKSLVNINPTAYYASDAWIHFQNEDGCIFSMRNTKGDYPDFTQFFGIEGTKIQLPTDLSEGIALTSVLVDQIDPIVHLRIAKNTCTIKVASDGGSIQHRAKVKYKGDPIVFLINVQFLKEIITHTSTVEITESVVKLQSDGFSLVTALYAESN